MAGNWMDDRERQIRERDARGASDYRSRGGEDRSWDDRPDMYGPRGGPGRERVFGERESGASYGRAGSESSGGRYDEPSVGRGWQDPNYSGVSPAMQRGEYRQGRRFSHQDYTRQDYRSGGRFYGDDNRERVYRGEYGQGGVEYGDVPSGYDADGYSPTRAQYHSEGYGQSGFGGYGGEYRGDAGRPASGGTGGYDYERGYGDGGRRETRRTERFEDAGRSAGDFLHRAGEKVAAWFGGGGEARAYEPGTYDRPASRGARGLGPQGYKRSDERISDDAHERLTDDTWLDATNIAISVSGGEITLSGTVESREAKHRAERLVENISGVNHVQNNLRLAKGGFLTTPTSGYGDSVVEAQMRRDDPAANGTGGAGSGQSTAGKKN